ncbi:MAG: glycosyltransferase family 2 protein [Deltaproteobacteria bacterium]|nr:glycosyltransferase family 2 protein [Deltaproteobacteria bacterium]
MLAVSCVMYAYNEEENVIPCMEEALAFLRESTSDHELILVSDGSTDGSAAAARSVQERDPEHVQVVEYHPNRGIGGALKAGYGVAKHEWICGLPADGQIPPSGLQGLFDVAEADDEIGVVTCSFPHRFEEADNLVRKVLSRGLRVVMWGATGVSRTMDGVWLIRRADYESITTHSDTFFFNLELPIKAIRSGLKPGASTMRIRPRRAGESKVVNRRRIQQVIKDLAGLGFELRLGRRLW